MFDKWICKFVNYFEEDGYKRKIVTFGNLFSLFFGLLLFILGVCFVGVLWCVLIGTIYSILTGNDVIGFKSIFVSLITACFIIVNSFIVYKLWNIEIAKCDK